LVLLLASSCRNEGESQNVSEDSCLLANIRTVHFQNKILERYRQTSLVGNRILCEGTEPLPSTDIHISFVSDNRYTGLSNSGQARPHLIYPVLIHVLGLHTSHSYISILGGGGGTGDGVSFTVRPAGRYLTYNSPFSGLQLDLPDIITFRFMAVYTM
jgi:hypothetical protein